ncbi:type VI secretion system protein TssA [Candidatus Finniella inopinata]|uniref:Type VI secretion system protein TssA n=1 Tax=Candidatus Finniella inopinata TaxID=1696036 RepID=A0A4Q7DHT4_9PROT|nr:type VI secretion system protein TssA [Candidatus Finniella inopinata]RZI45910.1 type VI secretion system protein TssA [Candidatus Finniella inopinata]
MSATVRSKVDFPTLISPLQEGGEAGVYLRYDLVYDQIREARREEDSSLSQGIWQTEFKRADWPLVEKLCVETLSTRSKDLQIAAWLTEAWIVLDQLKGAIQGITLITNLCTTYWPALYPVLEDDDSESVEQRLSLFEWMDEHFANRLLFSPLTYCEADPALSSLSLADWLSATNLEVIAKRTPDGKNLITQAENQGNVTLNRFRKALELTAADHLQTLLDQFSQLLHGLDTLCHQLKALVNNQAPSFNKLRNISEEIVRILKTSFEQKLQQALKEDAPNLPLFENTLVPPTDPIPSQNPDVVTISERHDAYQALKDIGGFLKSLDGHSPAPYLLELIVSWENKTLVEILSDIGKGNQEGHVLLRLLANAIKT